MNFSLLLWNCVLSLWNCLPFRAGDRTPTIVSVFGIQQPTEINDEVYALHVPAARPTLEVVFFHGFALGNYQDSYWRNWLCADEKQCWPKTWLAEDWPDARVLSVSYDSSLTETSTTGRVDLYCIAENLEKSLIRHAKVGQNDCPVIFVGHSLGGVVMKALCTRAKGYPAHKRRPSGNPMEIFVANLKGLFFLATPHNGSIFSEAFRSSFAGPLMDELKVLDSRSARLNQDFGQFLDHHPSIKLWGVGESHPTRLANFFGVVVPEGSTRFDRYGDFYTAPADHFGVCKPESKGNCTYQVLKEFLDKVINEAVVDGMRGIDGRTVVRETTPQGPPSVSFKSDVRYVRLRKTEEEVMTALRDPRGSPIVLLHGGPGTGKSAMARSLALHFQDERAERTQQRASTGGLMFDRVLYMECGRDVTLETKQRELIDQLDMSRSKYAGNTEDVEEKWQLDRPAVKQLLSNLLKERPTLVVLDDVWKFEGKPSEFLQGMVDLGDESVKWLVTSQFEHLCEKLNIRSSPIAIGIEKVERGDARRILAALTGLEESGIPKLQAVMDRIIDKTGANPLAMTCVASAMMKKRCQQEGEWKRLLRDLSVILNSPDGIPMHSKVHGLSYFGAIKLCFTHLSRAQKNLLILIHMCKGPSVSSGVIEYLFQQTRHRSWSEAFSKARDALEGRQLLTIKTTSDPTLGDKESWSIHDLLREFITREVFGDLACRVPIVNTLAKEEIMFEKGSTIEEHEVVMSVASLYFDNNFSVEFDEKMALSSWTPELADLRREEIDPIAQLLGLTTDEEWTPALHSCISKVFLTFVKNRVFDEMATSSLLNSPISRSPILCSLFRSTANSNDNHFVAGRQIIHDLFRLLEDQITLVIEASSSWILCCDHTLLDWISASFSLALGNSQDKNIAADLDSASFQTVINGLIFGLNRVDDHSSTCHPGVLRDSDNLSGSNDVRECCANTLANLAHGVVYIKERMIDFPDLLESLVKGMRTKDSLGVQQEVARFISNLTAPDGTMEIIGLKIVDYPGVLDALVDGLRIFENQLSPWGNAFALANLAKLPGNQIKWKIIMFEGALRRLIFAMLHVHEHQLNKHSARALGNLVCGRGGIKEKMIDFPGLLESLVKAITKKYSLGVEQVASDVDEHQVNQQSTRALVNLACGDAGIKEKMIDFPELLDGLVKAMRMKDSPGLQKKAAHTISNLASPSGTEIMGLKIVDYRGLLGALMDGLDSSENKLFQENSAWALANLAQIRGDRIKWKIVMFDFPELLESLVKAMRTKDFPSLQVHAARAIHNLAKGGSDIRMKMKEDCLEILDVLENAVAMGEKSGGDIYDGISALTLLDPLRAKVIQVDSAVVYLGRGGGELLLGLYKDACEDLDRYEAICLRQQNPHAGEAFSWRCCAKAKLGDLQGALADAERLVGLDCAGFGLQERGVVKCMLGDLSGALADLNASLRLSDEDDYEVLKHRGFVHFLMNDEESARADAERALRCKPGSVDNVDYGRGSLGASSVQYLDFEFR